MDKFTTADGTPYEVAPEHLDIFLERFPDATKVEPGKTNDPAVVEPTVGSENMGSSLDDGSSVSQSSGEINPTTGKKWTREEAVSRMKEKEWSNDPKLQQDVGKEKKPTDNTLSIIDLDIEGSESIGDKIDLVLGGLLTSIPKLATDSEQRTKLSRLLKNRVDNIPEAFQSALISAQQLYIDTYTSNLSPLLPGDMKKQIKKGGDELLIEKFAELKTLDFKDVGEGMVAGSRKGDAADVVAGVFGAAVSMVETVVPAMMTGGASLPIQIAAPMYTDYNIAKAKVLYGEGKRELTEEEEQIAIEKLVRNNETEIAIPVALGVVATGLEYIGFKGVTKSMRASPGKGAGLARLLWTGSGEGFTEVGQLGVEKLNEGLGAGKSATEASVDAFNVMTSDEGMEMWLNGFLGATQMTVASRTLNRAIRSDNASAKDLNDKVNNLAELNNKKYNTRNKEVKDAINIEVIEAEQDLKNFINSKRKINKILSESQKKSLINAMNKKDGIKSKVESLRAQLDVGNISSKEFGYAVRSLNNQDKGLNDKISSIQSEVLTETVAKEVEAVKGVIKESGMDGSVTEMSSEEISNIEEEGFDSKSAASQFGFIKQKTDGSFEIVLNKDKPNSGVAAHEFLHAVLFKTVGNNTEIQDNLGDALIDHAQSLGGDASVLGERLSAYGKYEGGEFVRDANFGEETMTIMSESIVNGSLKFDETFFTKVGDVIRRFSQNYLGKEITFDTGRDVYNFVKDYSEGIKSGKVNKAILNVAKEGAKGKLVEGNVEAKAGTQLSKTSPEKLVRIIKNPKKTTKEIRAAENDLTEQFDLLALKALKYDTRKGDISRDAVRDEARKYLPGIIKRFNPTTSKFSTFVNGNMAPKQAVIYEKVKSLTYGDTVSIDTKEAREVVDTSPETTERSPDTRRKKTNVLKIGKVERKADTIKKIVKVKEGDTFKEVSDNNTGRVAEEIFEVPASKITDPAKNLTYAKKIKDGIPEPSEAGNIQTFYTNPQVAEKLIKILPTENVTSSDADINEIGENIDVDREVLGRGLGLNNRMLNYFYEKTDKRSKGKTSQPFIWKLKSEFNNPKPKVTEEFQKNLGITPRGELNNYNRNIGQLLKGVAKFQAQQTALSTVQRILTEQKVNVDKAGKIRIANITTAQSKLSFSKDGKKYDLALNNNENFKDTYIFPLGVLGAIHGIDRVPNKQVKRTKTNGGVETYSTRDLDARFSDSETYNEAGSRVINTFIESHPEFRDLLKITMTGGVKGGFFQTVGNFNKLINSTNVTQRNPGKSDYNGKKRFLEKVYKRIGTKEFKLDQKQRLPLLFDFFKAIEAHLQNFPTDVWMFEEMLLDTGKQQNTVTRILAPFSFYPVNTKTGKPIFNENAVEEHTDPQNQIGKSMLAAATFGKVDEVWRVVGKSYMQGSLLETDDNALGKQGLGSSMPDVYFEKIVPRLLSGELNLPNGYSSIVRLASAGINPNSYFLVDAGMTVAQFFKVDGISDIQQANELITQQLTGEITADYADNVKRFAFSRDTSKVRALSNAINVSRSTNNPVKGITVLDFDDTLATSNSLIRFTKPDGTKGTLNAEQYASTYQELTELGYKWDFSEFNKVVDGKTAPLFNKAMKLQGKFGPENMFVLTARPSESAPAIFAFLQANGLNIPLKNITGLANSTAESKANWIAEKVGEGYNDFYFADDALQNVEAVKNMLNQFDVKSKVQQARVKFSKEMNENFNDILESLTGIESVKRFGAIKGRKRGESKGKFRYFIPPSHEDFVGLLYNFMGKGRVGDGHRDFFEQALVRPLNRANREYDTARQSIASDYKELNKQFPDVRKKLTKKTADGDFTYQDAVRIYLWNKHGHKVPGLSPLDQVSLVELVNADSKLRAYADTLNIISKQDTYVNPTEGWNAGDIRMDLDDATGRVGRKQYFAEFNENSGVIFSEENLNKIEAGYGKGVRVALEDILYRIKTGRNRPSGQNETVNKFMNFLNGSVGTVMFFNMRSALLQQMSIVNYINYADNNVLAAAKAFANQKQYWSDFAFIFNSDMLKQRRGGIQTDINGAELAASLRNSKNTSRALVSKLLEVGFLPTQIGDNIAIATGGASYYRNRINTYIKQGMTAKDAEAAAFTDFQDITQSTQQSARPDMVSMQQASVLGKVILNFQNVTSQFNRLGKKAFQDIYNRRITKPNSTQLQSDISNASRITYYFAVQNMIFYTMQTALFAMMFGDDEDDENKLFIKKRERLINGSIDSVLRGTGVMGGIVATLKNVAIAFARQRDVKYNPDESAVALEALNLSPVLGIKMRKIVNAEKTLNYNKKVIDEMDTFDIDNPQWSAVTNYTEALTNVPLNRLYNKTQNMRQVLNSQNTAWERSLMFLGWSQYNLDIENERMKSIKEESKSGSKTSGRVAKERKARVR